MKKNVVILVISACFLVILSKPASAQVGVSVTISAHLAPPPLPVYEQPPCPADGYLWCPGYWAYTDDGYFWVPGVWVVPPRYGYLWTPPWWGFEAGVYGFHPGYWGPHVGFYGGVNYGYGYWGSGFVGGRWEGNHFRYNTAVVHVNQTVVHNTYVDNTVIVKNTQAVNRRISYNGGPGGINARPGAQERIVSGETHIQPTAEQTTHVQQARSDNRPVTPVQHESVRTQVVHPAATPAVNHTLHKVQSDHTDGHVAAKNHYAPTNLPKPVPQAHPHQQRHDYSRPEHQNPAMQPPAPQQGHMTPQQEHMAPQQEHMTQHQQPSPRPNHAAAEPHNPPPHGPEKNR